MALRHRQPPNSYDEISRRTVRRPDFSYRPTREEEQLSRHRFGAPTEHRPHWLTPEERELRDRVIHALAADPALDVSDVTVDVDDDEVVLVGSAPGPATVVRIEEIVAAMSGVASVDNQLIARSGRD
jgi:hypothetical protein